MCCVLFVFASLIYIQMVQRYMSVAAADCCWVISLKLCGEVSAEVALEVPAFRCLLPERHLFAICHLNKKPNWKQEISMSGYEWVSLMAKCHVRENIIAIDIHKR